MGFDDLRQQSLAVQEQQAAASQSLMDRTPLFKDLKPRERFIIALFMFLDVTILGLGCLLASGRMMP